MLLWTTTQTSVVALQWQQAISVPLWLQYEMLAHFWNADGSIDNKQSFELSMSELVAASLQTWTSKPRLRIISLTREICSNTLWLQPECSRNADGSINNNTTPSSHVSHEVAVGIIMLAGTWTWPRRNTSNFVGISDFNLQNSDSRLQIDDSSSNAFSTMHHSGVGMYLN